jgi:hypothetical protein
MYQSLLDKPELPHPSMKAAGWWGMPEVTYFAGGLVSVISGTGLLMGVHLSRRHYRKLDRQCHPELANTGQLLAQSLVGMANKACLTRYDPFMRATPPIRVRRTAIPSNGTPEN